MSPIRELSQRLTGLNSKSAHTLLSMIVNILFIFCDNYKSVDKEVISEAFFLPLHAQLKSSQIETYYTCMLVT